MKNLSTTHTPSREQLVESISLGKAMIPELTARWEKAPTGGNANTLHQMRESVSLCEAKLAAL